MSSAVSSEEELLPFLAKAKEEDKLTWEQFGNGDWDDIKAVCQNKWALLDPGDLIRVKTIWKNHPANQKAPQQGK